MSWGERSCGHLTCPIPAECEPHKCNVDCRMYKPNGKRPDSVSKKVKMNPFEAVGRKELSGSKS